MLQTYCVDKQVPDSACTATAYLCGVKANFQTVGVTASVTQGNCSQQDDPANKVDSILSWAQNGGKSTGDSAASMAFMLLPIAILHHLYIFGQI